MSKRYDGWRGGHGDPFQDGDYARDMEERGYNPKTGLKSTGSSTPDSSNISCKKPGEEHSNRINMYQGREHQNLFQENSFFNEYKLTKLCAGASFAISGLSCLAAGFFTAAHKTGLLDSIDWLDEKSWPLALLAGGACLTSFVVGLNCVLDLSRLPNPKET